VTDPRATLHALFALIGRLPAIPPAVDGEPWRCRAMHARAALGLPCSLCGRPASAALIYGPSDLVGAAAWLDACWPCYADLRELGAAISDGSLDVYLDGGLPVHGDAAVLIRYQRWQASCG
jgi:hypothetical protein